MPAYSVHVKCTLSRLTKVGRVITNLARAGKGIVACSAHLAGSGRQEAMKDVRQELAHVKEWLTWAIDHLDWLEGDPDAKLPEEPNHLLW